MSDLLKDYDYFLPEELIAQEPLEERSSSRMMVLRVRGKGIQHDYFSSLPEYLREGDLLIVNDTSVIPARLCAQKESGGVLEVFLLRPLESLEWHVLLSPTRGLKIGDSLLLKRRNTEEVSEIKIKVTSLKQEDFRIAFAGADDQSQALTQWGEMPLPPYIKRARPDPKDLHRYQTLFAHHRGAVAAPTAGLHFTEQTRRDLADRGVVLAPLTLHVGLGTFQPIRSDRLADHFMHEEYYEIPDNTLEQMTQCQRRGGRVLAVGTTVLRALESFGMTGAKKGWTDLFIRPGYTFKVVQGLLTNFHQPRSTLLVLVSALAGREFILEAYRQAIAEKYRLFSYGDCMLVLDTPSTATRG